MRKPVSFFAASSVWCAFVGAAACGSTTTQVVAEDAAPVPTVEAGPAVGTKTVDVPLDRARIGSDSSKPDFQKASGKLDLTGTFQKVTLVVDLESPCFPFDK